jgi:ATPase subunit of ABC transporter with duplicated ATPase domains
MSCSRILIHDVKFNFFEKLNLSFSKQKTGLVGRNGSGKSTLLKLILGKCHPESGNIIVDGFLHYLPQIPAVSDENKLSSGEITRELLAKAFSSHADFLLLDEPTNHLDQNSKQQLYEKIRHWRKGLIIASHDRELLNLMDTVFELSARGVTQYGGNYENFVIQKCMENSAKTRQLEDTKKHFKKTHKSIQLSYEKHAQKQAYGKLLRKKGSIDKMSANSKKGRSEKSQANMLIKSQRMMELAHTQLYSARERIEINEEINIQLPETVVPNGKTILEIKNINFTYPESNYEIIKNFNLVLNGPKRIALNGNNGCGKSTLLKLIQGQLQPNTGSIKLGTTRIAYLDQHASQLNPTLSVLNNFLQFNPASTPKQAHLALAQFLFRNTAAQKIVGQLSGGEKCRALLACLLMSPHPPQLLLLDEPTNHTMNIESALKHSQGAMIVASHDAVFLNALECSDDTVYF